MNIDLAALPDDVETLHRMVRTLAAERVNLTEAQADIERLRLIVQKLQRTQFGRRAERLDDDQLRLGLEDLNADIARVEATLPEKIRTPASRSRTDRPSLPAHLPREDMRIDLDQQTCPCCGRELHAIGETVSEMLDHVPARIRIIRICRPRYGCRACGTIHQAAAPERPIAIPRLCRRCLERRSAFLPGADAACGTLCPSGFENIGPGRLVHRLVALAAERLRGRLHLS